MPQRVLRSLAVAAPDIASGDLLLFRGVGLISRVIGVASRSPYTHAAKAIRWGGMLFCCEVRELKGGRAVTLESQVRSHPGQIDVFAVNAMDDPLYARSAANDYMKKFCGSHYGYWNLLKTAALHTPVLRFLCREDYDLENGDVPDAPPYCSQAVALADRYGGGVDPVPNLPDRLTEPGDLARSTFYRYKFTLSGA